MILKLPILAAAGLLAGSLLTASCTGEKTGDAPLGGSDSGRHYSIRSYISGQAIALSGQPLTLHRISREGDAYDSALVPIYGLNWKEVIERFAGSDISDRRFVGQYSFSISDDDLTATRVLTYTATRPDLFTRLFQINTDPENDRVKSIYIETRRSGFWRSLSQKLLYIPGNVVQVQETEDPLIGTTKRRRLEYKFLRDDPGGVHIVEE